ncbi:MAG: hypothetical protein CBC36_01180 [Verrucomicrobiaceae bacterium TMED76]|nr:MAG: hypothetical protein CBC36_01180 [Verrucomicrobiaceae bacterium TMED76]
MQSIISLLYIGLGGFIGAISRWGVSQIIRKSTDDGVFPLPTLIVNLLGCLGIGIAYSIWENNNSAKLIIIIGFLGGFTTFSTFAYETLSLIKSGNTVTAISYVTLSSVIGVFLVWVGMKLNA